VNAIIVSLQSNLFPLSHWSKKIVVAIVKISDNFQ
jgi:hypothetical protein